LDGNGSIVTRAISGEATLISIRVSASAAGATRVTNFVFSGGATGSGYKGRYIIVNAPASGGRFRIDHNEFGNAGSWIHLDVHGCCGLIDNNTFTMQNGGEVIHNNGYGHGNSAGWSYEVKPGSEDAVYIEDNEFYNIISGNPAYFRGGSAVQNYYGARVVFRYNYCKSCQIDVHGTAGFIGGRWWEIYENTFDFYPNTNQDKIVQLRGGSGVVFNNTTVNRHLLAGNGPGIIMYEDDSGSYPQLYQVGRGKDQSSFPAYIWDNDPRVPVGSSSSALIQEGRDYFRTPPSYNYVPYVYPHPLQGEDGPRPNAPSNLGVLPD